MSGQTDRELVEQVGRLIADGVWGEGHADIYFDPRYAVSPDERRLQCERAARSVIARLSNTPAQGEAVALDGELVEKVAEAIWGSVEYRPVGWSLGAMSAIRTALTQAPAPVDMGVLRTECERLFGLLDDIDTLDDACRADDAAFREQVRAVQRKRFDGGITTDGYTLNFAALSPVTLEGGEGD